MLVEPVLKQYEASWKCGLRSVNPPQLAWFLFRDPPVTISLSADVQSAYAQRALSPCLSKWITMQTEFYTQVLYVSDVLSTMGICPCVFSSFSTSSETGIRLRCTPHIYQIYSWIV